MRMREVECGACMAAVPVSHVIPLINLTTVHSPVTMQTMFAVMGLQLLGGLLRLRIESQYDTCFFPMFRVLAYCLLIVVYHTKTSRTVSFFFCRGLQESLIAVLNVLNAPYICRVCVNKNKLYGFNTVRGMPVSVVTRHNV